MSNKRKPNLKQICEGCLSGDRKLLPIQQYMHTYLKLMEDFLRENGLHETVISKLPLMCWECRSFLRNTQKFQKRAIQSYEILQMRLNKNNSEIFGMSTLTTTISKSPDYEINYESKALSNEYENEILKIDKKKEECKYEIDPDNMSLKEESYVNNEVKVETDNDYFDDMDDITNADSTDLTGIPAGIKEELSETLKQVMYAKRNKTRKGKFKVISEDEMKYPKFDELCTMVEINEEERKQIEAKLRERRNYVISKLKCERCILGYTNKNRYKRHMERRHSKSKKFECDACGYRVKTKQALTAHVNVHKYKYICTLCGYEGLKKHQMILHLSLSHQHTVECRECGLRFSYRQFYKHFREMHQTFVCDYCGRKCTKKQRLINHIRIRHSEHVCQFCNRKYAKHYSLMQHISLRHTRLATEEAYCVECDIQFDNVPQFQNHLKMSVKHRPKVGIPCPECGKLYAKNIAMKNHYNHVHLKKTKFYCELCCRYFLNGFRLRQHTASFHQKIKAPRNKICMHCGRGFRTNRILDNHIRTHTGERPFACTHCSASFAQKSALVSHARSIHKLALRYAETAPIVPL